MTEETVVDAKDGVSTLAILTPDAEEIEVGGKKVLIGPLKISQLAKFSKAIQKVLPGILTGLKADGSFDLMKMVSESGDDLIAAVAIGCKQPEEWVGDLDPVEFMKLAGKIMVVNVDFFARRLPQMTHVLTESLVAVNPELKTQMAGQRQSKD